MNNFDNIVLREKEKRLSISRVPRKTKEEFVAFANEEFEEDYGMCLKHVWDQYKIWKMYFENLDMKLDIIINKLNQPQPQNDSDTITLLDGQTKIQKGGKNSNGSTK